MGLDFHLYYTVLEISKQELNIKWPQAYNIPRHLAEKEKIIPWGIHFKSKIQSIPIRKAQLTCAHSPKLQTCVSKLLSAKKKVAEGGPHTFPQELQGVELSNIGYKNYI